MPTGSVLAPAPGVTWFRGALSLDAQRTLADHCRTFLDGPAGGYVPTVRGGGKMRVQMCCLGRHWNPLTYSYGPTRADHDNAPVPPLPADLAALAGDSFILDTDLSP